MKVLYFFSGALPPHANSKREHGPTKTREEGEEQKMSSDRIQLALQKRLNACLKKPENVVCAECPSRLPRWASMNLGDFHMHELLWNPQKFRSAHFEGTIDAVG